ncbi:class I SAM-dependent rRNA methyltransferase [Clostridium sp. BJN0001]|uniref:class I SAM-dependent rRNA methyltransferase n=1 Tax=Clostridium sp. BJN0001 TaxID=2930219 RepID=UPI001FD144B5|nr:class I SAM-dependent rRNA methyltransferase [Clostridium sp. BJN0001]
MDEINVKIKKQYVSKYKNGYPIITKDSVLSMGTLDKEGQIIRLTDEKGGFIAKGYYGLQNKCIGWVLTTSKKASVNYKLFYDKIRNSILKREKFYYSKHTNAFRVFNGEGDGIGGLTIDYYNGYYLITWYSEGIYEYRDIVLKCIKSLVPFDGIYQKKRFEHNGMVVDEDSFVCGKRNDKLIVIKENDVKFAIYLNDGAMTGIFLDQKDVRKSIKEKYSKGKKILNTFSYTGAFSVAAATSEAYTTSVDLAKRSLPKTTENFNLNKIDLKNQKIVVEDIFNFFKEAKNNNIKYDMVILDPPSFSNSKENTFSASRDYKDLLKLAVSITENDGIIVASTNCSTFNMNKFKVFIDDAMKEKDVQYEILEEHQLPKDFSINTNYSESNYLKVVFIKLI